MKKPYIWAGIIGALIIAFNVLGIAGVINNPTAIHKVNVAMIVSDLAALAAGVFLLCVFFVGKKREDAGHVAVKPAADTPEDIVRLERMRDWVVSLFILYEIVQSVGAWVLNNYFAGLTLVNSEMIFDLAINLVLLVLIIELLRGKKIINLVLAAIIAMVVVEGTMAYFRQGVLELCEVVVIAPYFIYAIRMKLTRFNFRIANFVLLPATIVAMLGLGIVATAQITGLAKQEGQLEQEYVTQDGVTAQAYSVFLQKSAPTQTDIESVKDNLAEGDAIAEQILGIVAQVEAVYNKQVPTIEQQETLAHLAHYTTFIDLNLAQANAMDAFMDYASTVDFASLTTQQASKLNDLKQAVDAYSTQIATAAYTLSHDSGQ